MLIDINLNKIFLCYLEVKKELEINEGVSLIYESNKIEIKNISYLHDKNKEFVTLVLSYQDPYHSDEKWDNDFLTVDKDDLTNMEIMKKHFKNLIIESYHNYCVEICSDLFTYEINQLSNEEKNNLNKNYEEFKSGLENLIKKCVK